MGWGVVATALYGFSQRAEFRAYFDRPSKLITVSDFPIADFDRTIEVETKDVVRRSGVRTRFGKDEPGDYFALPPGDAGTLSIRFQKPAGYLLDIWPNVPVTDPNTYQLDLRTDRTQTWRTVLRDKPHHWGNLLTYMDKELAEELRLAASIELRVSAVNRGTEEIRVLNWLWVRAHEPIRPDFYVFPGLFGAWGVLFSVLGLVWALSSPRNAARALVVAGVIVVVALLAWVNRDGPIFSHGTSYWRLKWAVFGLGLVLSFTGKLSNRGFLLVTAPLWLAVVSNWFWYEAANNAYGYLHGSVDNWTRYGREMKLFTSGLGFFSGGFNEREPLYILFIHLFGKLFGATTFSHLNLTLFLMTFGAVLSYVAGGLLIGRPWITLLLGTSLCYFRFHHSVISDFQRESLSFPLIGLATFAMFYRSDGSFGLKGRGLFLVALSVLLVLTRSVFLTSIILMVGIAVATRILARKWGWRLPQRVEWAVLALVVLAPILAQAPIKANQARIHGSASYFSEQYARWIANVEFQDRLGSPGFPTRQEFLSDSFAGPKITYFEYLFKLRSFHDLLKMNYEGLGAVLSHHAGYLLQGLKQSGHVGRWQLLLVLAFFALWVSIREKSWVLFWLAIWYLAQNAYAFHLFKRGMIGVRHVDHAFFTLVVLFGLTLRKTVDHASTELAPRLERLILGVRSRVELGGNPRASEPTPAARGPRNG